MARPRKTGLDYFPLDVDFFSDEKIIVAAGKFGIVAEVAAMRLLCCIYRKGYYVEWNEPLKYKLLRELPGTDADTLDAIVAELARWGFFDSAMLTDHGVLTSEDIQGRYFAAMRRNRPAGTQPYLLVGGGVSAAETPVNVAETPQIKEKEIKEKEIKQTTTITTISGSDVVDAAVEEVKSDSAAATPPAAVSAAETCGDAAGGGGEFSLDNFLERFYASFTPDAGGAMLRSLGIDINAFRTLAAAVVSEWKAFGVPHSSFAEARRHLYNSVRMKLKVQAGGGGAPAAKAGPSPEAERRMEAARLRREAEREADRERTRRYNEQMAATGMSGLDAYRKMRGIDPSVSIADLAASFAV